MSGRRRAVLAAVVVLALGVGGCGAPVSRVGPYVRRVEVVRGDLLVTRCWIELHGDDLVEGPCAEERVAIPR